MRKTLRHRERDRCLRIIYAEAKACDEEADALVGFPGTNDSVTIYRRQAYRLHRVAKLILRGHPDEKKKETRHPEASEMS